MTHPLVLSGNRLKVIEIGQEVAAPTPKLMGRRLLSPEIVVRREAGIWCLRGHEGRQRRRRRSRLRAQEARPVSCLDADVGVARAPSPGSLRV